VFDAQAAYLQKTNVVYASATYDADLVAQWCGTETTNLVPHPILDCAVEIPMDTEDPGAVLSSGPGDATAAGHADKMDEDVAHERQSRVVSAFHPDDIPGAKAHESCMQITGLQHQLEDLDAAAARSVAAEAESILESQLDGNGSCLQDGAGRERILELCAQVRKTAQKATSEQSQHKMLAELQWLLQGVDSQTAPPAAPSAAQTSDAAAVSTSTTVPHLQVARGSKFFSLFNWEAMTQARPTLWQYGDGAFGDPQRAYAPYVPLLPVERITCLLMREELEYTLDGERE